ncbi:hypothetical protein GR160_02975 [Flavobacterium sp. Sd200]|uniref:hypothetical protein n=1 Tax=Flavobacterium sp. Sd200 TaxID=2692211 RepID=UPI001369A877|nr:hypothetical protein [Flavobacterium sp. Sd200]MXN90177.1 hypothetical protein [Flavobacterium sp. Sd200]
MPVFCSVKSRIKMIALTKPGLPNIIWFSILSHDHKPEEKIIAGMLRRFQATKDINITQVIQFYDNQEKKRPKIVEYR